MSGTLQSGPPSRVTAVVTARPTPLVSLANEINNRDAEQNLVRFGSAEAEDGHCEHGHILADVSFIGAKCGARKMKSAQSLQPAPLIPRGSGSLVSAVGSEESSSSAQHKPQQPPSCVSCRRVEASAGSPSSFISNTMHTYSRRCSLSMGFVRTTESERRASSALWKLRSTILGTIIEVKG